jgi:hypothetical protein
MVHLSDMPTSASKKTPRKIKLSSSTVYTFIFLGQCYLGFNADTDEFDIIVKLLLGGWNTTCPKLTFG